MAKRFTTTVRLESGLIIPASAVAGRVLTSQDASGNAAWQTLPTEWIPVLGPVAAQFGSAQAAVTSMMAFPVAAGAIASGFSLLTTNVPIFRWDPSDHSQANRSTQWRIVSGLVSNTVAPGTVTYTVGLYPITPAGAAGALTGTVGTVLAGSTVAIATPGASANARGVGSAFSINATSMYALGVVTSAAAAANSAVRIQAMLMRSYA